MLVIAIAALPANRLTMTTLNQEIAHITNAIKVALLISMGTSVFNSILDFKGFVKRINTSIRLKCSKIGNDSCIISAFLESAFKIRKTIEKGTVSFL
jgi:hypothetical protein